MRILVLDTADGRARTLARSLAADLGLPLIDAAGETVGERHLETRDADDGYLLLAGATASDPVSALEDGGDGPELILSLAATRSEPARLPTAADPEREGAAIRLGAGRRVRQLRPEGTDLQVLAAAHRMLRDLRTARAPTLPDVPASPPQEPARPTDSAGDTSASTAPTRNAPDAEATTTAPQPAPRAWKQAAERKGKLVRGIGRGGKTTGKRRPRT